MPGGGGQKLGGGSKRRKKAPYVGMETTRQFNSRLHHEGRWDEYEAEARDLMASEGIRMPEARERLAAKYGAKFGVLPMSAAEGFRDEDGSYLETMDWVARALGWAKEGRPVSRLDAPGPKTWAMFQWAGGDDKSQDKFWAMYTQAHNKSQAAETSEGDVETERSVGELEAMLREVNVEAAEISEAARGTVGG